MPPFTPLSRTIQALLQGDGFYDPDEGDHDPTPEPASFLLMGTGLRAILRRRLART